MTSQPPSQDPQDEEILDAAQAAGIPLVDALRMSAVHQAARRLALMTQERVAALLAEAEAEPAEPTSPGCPSPPPGHSDGPPPAPR